MSDQGSGLQPVGGLAPVGGLSAVGGNPEAVDANGRVVRSGEGEAGATTPRARANPMPELRAPTPSAKREDPLASPSFSTSVFVPERPADAEVWQEPRFEMRKLWPYLGGIVTATLATGTYFVFRTPPRASVPTGYTVFQSGDNLWAFDAPKGWSLTAGGAASGDKMAVSFNGVTCTSGSARVEVLISTVSGLVKRQLLFGSSATPEAMSGSHSNDLQDSSRKGFQKEFRNYKETEVTENLPTAMGQRLIKGFTMNGISVPDIKTAPDVRMAEFTASGNRWGLGGPVHGYRATLGGTRLIASVTCQCSERDWASIKPGFTHVLASIHQMAQTDKTLSADPMSGSSSVLSPVGGL